MFENDLSHDTSNLTSVVLKKNTTNLYTINPRLSLTYNNGWNLGLSLYIRIVEYTCTEETMEIR